MSLINQMLKELDARRSEVTGTDAFGQQIRAVPDRSGIHPAWIVAAVLAVISSALLAWLLLRPPIADPALSAKLPLKFDSSLGQGKIAAHESLSPPITTEKPLPATEASPPAPQTAPMVFAEAPPPVPLTPPETKAPSVSALPGTETPENTGRHNAIGPTPVKPKGGADPAVKLPENSRPTGPRNTRDKIAVNIAPDAAMTSSVASSTSTESLSTTAVKQVKELSPQQRADVEYRKALAILQQGKTTDSVAGFERALQLDPRHTGARQALIGAFIEGKRIDDALRTAREGLSVDPAQPGLAMISARLYLEKGDLRSGIDTLERSASHAMDRPDYQAFLAALLQRDGQHKKAADQYLLALQKAPQNGVWWMGLGISLQADQRTTDAQEAFKRAKASNSLTPELLSFVESRLSQLQRAGQ